MSRVKVPTLDPTTGRVTDSQLPKATWGTFGQTITAVKASGGDDTAAIQSALNTGDVLLLGDGGTFNVGLVSYQGTASRRIVALGPVTINQTNAQGVFDLNGTWDTLGTVSSYTTATVNDGLQYPGEGAGGSNLVTQLTLAAPAIVAQGDLLKVVSDDVIPTAKAGGSGQERRQGEYVLAGMASTDVTVTLSSVLFETHTTNVRLVRLRDVSFTVDGPITFDTDASIRNTSAFGAVILLRGARECRVRGATFQNSLGRAIGNFTFGSSFERLTWKNLMTRPTKAFYGYGIQDGGWGTKVANCQADRLRHLYTADSILINANTTEYSYYGGSAFGEIVNCHGQNCENSPFDTHGGSYGHRFANCTAMGSFRGADSGGPGFSLRGRKHTLQGCFADGCRLGFVVSGDGCVLNGCVARRTRVEALSIGGDTDAPTFTNLRCVVNGGLFESSLSDYAMWMGSSGFNLTCDLNDVVLRTTGPDASSDRVIDMHFTSTLRFHNLTLDLTASTFSNHSGINLSDDTNVVKGRRLSVRLSSSYTGFTVINQGGTSQPASIEALEIDVEAPNNLTPTIASSAFTNAKVSWRKNTAGLVATSAFTSTAAVDAMTLPTVFKADPVVTVQLTGTAGAISLAALPAGFLPGQVLVLINSNSGTVTVPTTPGMTVAAGAAGRLVWTGSAWLPA